MVGVYLSGTGNTRHIINLFFDELGESGRAYPIEDPVVSGLLTNDNLIVLAYPTQFSNTPYAIKEFIEANKPLWKGKSIFLISTMGAFSGDSTGCAARQLKKHGAIIKGGLLVKMPDSVCDNHAYKHTKEKNKEIIAAADEKVRHAADMIKAGKYPRNGLSFFDHIRGLFGQRLWFYNKTTSYCKGPKVSQSCIKCGKCVELCPMKNLEISDDKLVSKGKCTMCYRCISMCPRKSLTIMGEKIVEQVRYEKYAD